ncbi:protein translocase subunit SecD [Seohaeicola sp. SP36]|uniref:protein translocase subunit SecD n=1 Tax=unclassified Seohaeicola TaxID=2641111 RepID=UPI00237C0D86|nr:MULTISPECIES: protein translocase subunit SecD [unclassified Seohaeicola]MDD9709547.1 protein translocase subunit SecD [Seohaeicola sp. 4SK31]MDD9737791.1 protein translocase subunit SecD [Seohaeicola sp. SP36]
MSKTLIWKRLLIWSVCLWGLIFALPNAFYPQVERYNDALAVQTETGALPSAQAADLTGWPTWLPSSLVNLGLDLRGGAHLMAEVQVEDVYAARMDAFWPQIRDALRDLRDEVGTIRRQDAATGELRIALSEPTGEQAALAAVRALASPVTSLTGAGQNDIEVRADGGVLIVTLSAAERAASDQRTMQQSLEIIRRRVDEVGTREPTIQRQSEDRILIQVPGIGSASELKALIGTTAKLSFHPVLGRAASAEAPTEPGTLILPSLDEAGVFYIVDQSPVVSGDNLVDAQPAFDQNNRPAVNFRFDPTGARAFGDYTAAHIGSPFAIVLDDEVISAPVIQSHIPGGSGIITGSFTVEESTDLAVLLRAGALPAGMSFLEERTIGPELGQDSIDAGQRAAVIGMVAVIVFMVACYGTFGVMAVVALGINMTLLMAALSVMGATLTLPGIAGIVLTMGMAVDANVLIFERIREELRQGRPAGRAITLGFDKALSAIMDSNLTGLLTALIMFAIGSGAVRGFAVTLGLGILTSMFTAVYVTRLIIETWMHWRKPARITLKGWIKLTPDRTTIDFFRAQWATFGVSAFAVVASLVLIATMGLNFGIDFKGGTTFRTESVQEIDLSAYRTALSGLQLGDVAISEVFDPTFRADQHVAMIRIQAQEGVEAISTATIAQVQETLRSVDPAVAFTAVDSVGPKVSAELIWLALAAVGAGAMGILAYVWMRFEWQFAVGTVAALVHDVIVTMGVFALFQLRFDLTIVAALLTILGYSVNDTVVIFDRLRENLAKYKTMPLRDLMNLSANETLSRTLMTAVTTLIALVVLLVFGGDVIRGFVFAMLFGVIVGTWSTLYVAKNIVLFLGLDRSDKAKRKPDHEFANIDA